MKTVYHLTLSAMFLALCIILPFITGGVPQIGNAISPMHIPGAAVRLCLRLAIRRGSRLYRSADAQPAFLNATDVSYCGLNGV